MLRVKWTDNRSSATKKVWGTSAGHRLKLQFEQNPTTSQNVWSGVTWKLPFRIIHFSFRKKISVWKKNRDKLFVSFHLPPKKNRSHLKLLSLNCFSHFIRMLKVFVCFLPKNLKVPEYFLPLSVTSLRSGSYAIATIKLGASLSRKSLCVWLMFAFCDTLS